MRSAWTGRVLTGFSVLLSLAALTITLVLIVMIKSRWHEVSTTSSKVAVTNWNGHVAAHIAVWSISCFSQFALYSLCFLIRHTPEAQAVSGSGPRDSVMSEFPNRRTSRDMFGIEATRPSSPLAGLPSPTFSHRSSKSLNSFRESIRHVVRPATSRTTLISRPSFSRSVYSDNQSCHSVAHPDGFDSWDTSSVSPCARDAVMQFTPSLATTLETIPGSRPATPARVLDSPLLSDLPEADEDLVPPPKMMPDTSRPPSPSLGNEGHIHPLFRSESPTPAPSATPGTSILASPLANQAIVAPSRSYSRMRSNSRTATSSPLVPARSIRDRRANSMRSLSRSPSPPSREMTPPIPDFVLNSSPRSSWSGSRRMQLQFSPDR
ncbi:hypothetical protein P153DRAFT_292070 [Dothidotthia symphoricarpi CBS 119687]|uniref:Uncharacterized protein n=1 Tax=Dothidotthia symphoricarpi CBS 119687 TaxID=1392245 RepID=A0A6A6AAG1_9PLEO|nr:uncharacterized protein P153DRAFT_292070 [Dothidotthia symphoricarpi CBS 119687]KAF2128779.1 hypothetical protein P153DRAFT_292070 [Dothidotthia symphoricarpi CBS 119687]